MSVRWSGHLTAPTSGDYTLSLTSLGPARLAVDDQVLIDMPTPPPAAPAGAPLAADASGLGVDATGIPLYVGGLGV